MAKQHVHHVGNFPRATKRMLLMGLAAGHIQDKHHMASIRALFIDAEKAYKNSRNSKRVAVADEKE